MNFANDVGYLEMFIGPMWSGKTSELLKLHKRFSFCEIPVLAINYLRDDRYVTNTICSHDMVNIPCCSATELNNVSDIVNNEVNDTFEKAKVVLINEGQFFKDIYDWVKTAVEQHNKQIYICGLDGDFQRNSFGDILKLIPICDKVTKLHSLCGGCKCNNAIFTHRQSMDLQQELIGTDIYVPLCRKCYIAKNIN